MGRSGNLGVIVTASLAGLLFGFDTVVISGVTDSLRVVFNIAPGSFLAGFSVAVGLVGTFLGALFAGKPGDKYGSRDSLKVVGAMYVVSALGCAVCWNFESFCVFRFIGGVAIGASSVLAPVYIAEIAPAEGRGRLTGLFQFNIVLGIVLAFLSNAFVAMSMTGEDPWRIKLGVADELYEIPGLNAAMLVALGKDGIKTVDDFAGNAADDLIGWTERKDGETKRFDGTFKDFPVSREEAEEMIMQARLKAGWVTEAELAPAEAVPAAEAQEGAPA